MSPDHASCSGCGLCQLVCPAWRRQRDVLYTPHGRAKAIQHGATANELADSLASCTLCGACEVLCPERIPIIALTLQMRGEAFVAAPPAITDAALHVLQERLRSDDLYIIEPRAYHADYERQVRRYDRLLKHVGCMSNLDLQRLAIPADDTLQARWILHGRTPARIVVERAADKEIFTGLVAAPAMTIAELCDDRPG